MAQLVTEWMTEMAYTCVLGRVPKIGAHNSVHEGRIYQLKLFCDKDYPEKPPTIQLYTGVVEPKKFGMLSNWQQHYTMETDTTEEDVIPRQSEIGPAS
ncbi:hypothetical protein MKX01_035698 [Papaver californicum]|nr:hypothetical protein MKX01_035698 [Papaver californicum]